MTGSSVCKCSDSALLEGFISLGIKKKFFSIRRFLRTLCVCLLSTLADAFRSLCSMFAWPRPHMLNCEGANAMTAIAASGVNGLQVHLESWNGVRKCSFSHIRPCPSVNENWGTVTTLRTHTTFYSTLIETMRLSCTVSEIYGVSCRKSQIFTYPTCIWHPVVGDPAGRILWASLASQN